MKLVTAIIRPDDLPIVMNAAAHAGARGLTASQASGFGQQYGHIRQSTRAGQPILLPKARVDVVVRDEDAGTIVNAIRKSASTGSIGDGKIWVSPVESVVRIRTDERDAAAI